MTFRPLRSACRLITRITARARSSNGQPGPSDCSSSSLMKSMPAPQRTSTNSAVCCGVKPIEGFTIVPISGRSRTPVSLRVPSTPNLGPG